MAEAGLFWHLLEKDNRTLAPPLSLLPGHHEVTSFAPPLARLHDALPHQRFRSNGDK
jgi:hypothetical protein